MTPEPVRATQRRLHKADVLDAWAEVLDVNYWPVFDHRCAAAAAHRRGETQTRSAISWPEQRAGWLLREWWKCKTSPVRCSVGS